MKKILLLPGDGIGPEQTDQTIRVMETLNEEAGTDFEVERALFGGDAIDQVGVPLPEETLKLAKSADAVLKAPIGGKKWESLPREKLPETGLLAIRKQMGLFANLRPAVMFDALINSSTLRPEVVGGLNIMIVRELSGGLYFGKAGQEKLNTGERYAFNTMEYTDTEIQRIMRVAFETARKRNKKVCSVDKANVLEVGALWRAVAAEVHKEYADVELTNMYVDNAAMQLVSRPKNFDVVVTENMFGDILSDESAELTGSLGMLPSASLSEPDANGKRLAMYEPIHGSAPDIAGKGVANPISMIMSLGMMLEYSFDNKALADKITQAVQNALARGYRTADLIKSEDEKIFKAGTTQMGNAIIAELRTLLR